MVKLVVSKPVLKLLYSEEPLVSKELDSSIREITPAELINMPHFVRKDLLWHDDIILPEKVIPTQDDFKKIDRLLINTVSLDNFVICNMGLAGYGVFAHKSIKKGQILFYSGDYKILSANSNFAYAIVATKTDCIDAQYSGGLASILLDLFPQQVALFPMLKKTISIIGVAENNFTIKLLPLSFGAIPYLEATRDIRPYTQCGFDYNEKYWGAMKEYFGIEKLYFNQDGKIIVGKDAEILKKIALIHPRKNSIMQAGKKLIKS